MSTVSLQASVEWVCDWKESGKEQLARRTRDVSAQQMYRDYVLAMLNRYYATSLQLGRMPKFLGDGIFRGRATSIRLRSFEDRAIFVHDMEKAIEQLGPVGGELLARVVFQRFTQAEVARATGIDRRYVSQQYWEALDRLAEILIDRGLMNLVGGRRPS